MHFKRLIDGKLLGLFFFLLFTWKSLKVVGQANEARMLTYMVADKIMEDTRFELDLVPQKSILGIQVIDFRGMCPQANQTLYARAVLQADKDTLVLMGLSGAGHIDIWLGDSLLHSTDNDSLEAPKEIAYNKFTFQGQFRAKLKKGKQALLVRYTFKNGLPVLFLRPMEHNGDLSDGVKFVAVKDDDLVDNPWLLLGPFDADVPKYVEILPSTHYMAGNKVYNWVQPIERFLPTLRRPEKASYKRHPYADWQYAHGIMFWSLMKLGDKRYDAFVKQYIDFTLREIPYFRYQYHDLFAYRGSLHRVFRRAMLDDTGAPCLPFAAYYLKDRDTSVLNLVNQIADYVLQKQHRLPDGTFCRPEPISFTVWADDLFMSVPFLLQMGNMTGNRQYCDEAVKQVLLFKKYLYVPTDGLFRHAWFRDVERASDVYWGRANGWIAWAYAELLEKLPSDHAHYHQLLADFRDFMKTLIRYQDGEGNWHQVLNRPDSYAETSCTAMFALAMARGVRFGWLDASFRGNALNGWRAVKANIDADGVVHGICQGTEVGTDEQFYMDRKTVDNDPRGLGAVLTLGMEIANLP